MKTKEQILDWLDKQSWANEFHRAVFTFRTDLNLSYNESFIIKAFQWNETEQGKDVWIMRDTEFRQWYNSNDKPTSWEEYCRQNPIKEGDYFITNACGILDISVGYREPKNDANVMSKDLCEAFIAYMKLIQLRNAWVKDCDAEDYTYKVEAKDGDILSSSCAYFMNGLSFPTMSMADEFIKTFKDLLEIAKPLL